MTLTELRKLAGAATPGPWTPVLGSGTIMMTALANDENGFVCDCFPDYASPTVDHRCNMDYIAALAPERILAMLDVIEAADAHHANAKLGWSDYDAARKRLSEL